MTSKLELKIMTHPKLGLVTKRSTLTFAKSIAGSSFLDLQDFRERERERQRDRDRQRHREKQRRRETDRERQRQRQREAGRINSLQGKLITPNFSYLNC